MTELRTPTSPAPVETGRDWLAFHIFYTANTRPLIVECVAPLVSRLRDAGLLRHSFFINYWLEGPHLRLRLLPAEGADPARVSAEVESAVRTFLARRPALYDVKSEFFVDMYNTLFDLEFEPEERAQYLGPDGRMRQQPNNSLLPTRYEPEYDKYGGPEGVALAEWHFERSSDLVARIDGSMNVHVRSVLLGLGAQLMMIMTTAFLRDEPVIERFLSDYHRFWRRAFEQTSLVTEVEYDKAYALMKDAVRVRFAAILDAHQDEQSTLPEPFGGWMEHCRELRQRVQDLAVAGRLTFQRWDRTGEETLTDPTAALERLLSPYLHMTNNRLQVTLGDEAYLSLVLARTLQERAAS